MISCDIGEYKLGVANAFNNLLLGVLALQTSTEQTLHARYLLYEGDDTIRLPGFPAQ